MADKQKEVIAEEYISSLRRRLETLEQKLIGEEKVREGQPALLQLLKTIDRKLRVISQPHEKVATLWNNIPKLEKFLDPSYAANLKLDDTAKEELLLNYADQLNKYQHDIEDIHELKPVLDDSTVLQGLETQEKKVSEVALTHIQQEQEVSELTSSVHQLIDVYTKFLLQMSSQCVKWDELVSSQNELTN